MNKKEVSNKKKSTWLATLVVVIIILLGICTAFSVRYFTRQDKKLSNDRPSANENITNKVSEKVNEPEEKEKQDESDSEEEKNEEQEDKDITEETVPNTGNNNQSAVVTPNTGSSSLQSFKDAINSTPLNPVITRYDKVDNQVGAIINSIISPGMSNYDKLVAIYNYMIQNTEYYTGDIEYNINKMKKEVGYLHYHYRDMLLLFQGLDVLENKSGVCFNYSALLLMLGRRVGFDIYTVNALNNEGGAHTFNVINAGGNYYILDSQGDDGGSYSLNYFFGKPLSQGASLYRAVYGINPFYNFAQDESYVEQNAIITIGDITIKSSADVLEEGSNLREYTVQVGKTISITTDNDRLDDNGLISSFTLEEPDGALGIFSYKDKEFISAQTFYTLRKVGDYHITFELKDPTMGDYAIVGFIVHVVE